MEQTIRNDILSILGLAVKALKAGDVVEIELLSNRTIHNASIYQDQDSLAIAVVIYALSRVVKNVEHHEIASWDKADNSIVQSLENSQLYLEKDQEKEYRQEIKNILKNIGSIDKKLEWYIEDVLQKSKIVKSAKLYEHGLSLGKAASLLGISQYELMSYVGKTQIIDSFPGEGISLKKRLGYAKELFKVS
jgi:hypothetical protein